MLFFKFALTFPWAEATARNHFFLVKKRLISIISTRVAVLLKWTVRLKLDETIIRNVGHNNRRRTIFEKPHVLIHLPIHSEYIFAHSLILNSIRRRKLES